MMPAVPNQARRAIRRVTLPIRWTWMLAHSVTVTVVMGMALPSTAEEEKPRAILRFDFAEGLHNLAGEGGLTLESGPRRTGNGQLEFTRASQVAVLDRAGRRFLSDSLRGVRAVSVGGWFYFRRAGEQMLVQRGEGETGALGERFFRPAEDYVNFCLGSDQHGFLLGTINGNGSMPFPHVTINDIPIMTWQQLLVVKDEQGFHHFYQNGHKVHDDRRSLSAPSRQPWHERDVGRDVPLRLQMPLGGLIAEICVVGRAMTAGEILDDYEAKRTRYAPAPLPVLARIRDMHAQPSADRPEFDRESVDRAVRMLLGPFPETTVPLDPRVLEEEDCGTYVRRKVSIQVQPDDRMPAYLLVPKSRPPQEESGGGARSGEVKVPAVICFYGTTGGAGKLTTVGLSGRQPGDPPHENLSFAIDMVKAGFVAFAADYLRDGQRIHGDDRPYDTRRFYARFPEWSIHGKDVWDTMRAIDYLQSLDFIDADRIGMVGHSYGGHSAIFTAAVEPRIRAVVANGPVSAFREHGMHWAVAKGGGSSQSLPAMRPFILNGELPLPVTFAQWTALIAPRPLLVGQAVGERRPLEEQNHAYVRRVYSTLQAPDQVRYVWYAGDHDFPPEARAAAVEWFQRWLRAVPD